MAKKPTSEELRQRVKELEKELVKSRKAQKALSASEKKYRTFFDNANDAVFIADVKTGVILDANKGAERLLGRSRRKIIGMHQSQLHPADQAEYYTEKFRKHVRDNRTVDFEAAIVKKDGTTVPVCISAAVMEHRGKKVIQGIFGDITERKRIEERVQLLSFAVEQSSEGIAVCDLEGNLLFTNSAFAAMHGYTEEELVGRHLSIFHTPEQMPSVDAANRQTQKTGTFSGEIWHVRRTGSVFPTLMQNSLLLDELGKPIGMIGTMRDITERLRAEEALRESEEKYRLLIENSGAAITFFDKAGTYLFLNHLAAKWLDGKPEDYIGKTVHDTFPKRLADMFVKRFRRIIKSGAGETIEEEVEPLDRWISSNLQPVRNQDGKVLGVQIVTYDITQRKQAEEALRQREAALEIRTNELEEANRALRVLLKQMNEYKTELEERVVLNVKELVLPYAKKLKGRGLDAKTKAYLSVLESNLTDIVSPFAHKLSSKHVGLTPAEIQIAHLIRDGRTTKDIAGLLNVSARTIESHRQNIRQKLGLHGKKANLRSHLFSM
jgi:PAS domain S-box-containing protein